METWLNVEEWSKSFQHFFESKKCDKRVLHCSAAAVAVTGLSYILLHSYIYRKPSFPHEMPPGDTYAVKKIVAPTLNGPLLRLFQGLLEMPVIGDLIHENLLSSNDFDCIDRLAHFLQVSPVYLPLHLCSDKELEEHVKMSKQQSYERILTDEQVRKKILYQPSKEKKEKKEEEEEEKAEREEDIYKKYTNYNKYHLLTIESIYNSYMQKKLSPLELAKQLIEFQEKDLKHLGLFIYFDKEDILKQAEESTKRWQSGKPLSVLDGIPVGVKDEIHVKGFPCTHGTKFMGEVDGLQTEDDILVERLRSMGAIIVAGMNMHEIGCNPTGVNPNYANILNPYGTDGDRDACGSSSGPAAAVAAGLFCVTLGADGGGSIRIPAGANGVVGLSATYGRIPFVHYEGAWSHIHKGAITSTLRDQMLMYYAIAGGIPNNVVSDPLRSLTNPPKHFDSFLKQDDLSDVTIGVWWDWITDADPLIVEQMKALISHLEKKYKARVKEYSISHFCEIMRSHLLGITAEFAAQSVRDVRNHRNFLPSTWVPLLTGSRFKAYTFVNAQKIRSYALQQMDHIFRTLGIDILITPSSGCLSAYLTKSTLQTKYGESNFNVVSEYMRFITLGNFVGIPGLVVPIGYASDGKDKHQDRLPVSVQLHAYHWCEHVLFRVGGIIEDFYFHKELPPAKNRVLYKNL